MFSKYSHFQSSYTLSQETTEDGFQIQDNGETIQIMFIDATHQTTKATLSSIHLEQRSQYYSSSQSDIKYSDETVMHPWTTMQGKGWMLKYSNQVDTALLLSSEGNLNTCLDMMMKYASMFLNIAYIKERHFCAILLKYTKCNIHQLRALPFMNEERIQLLYQNVRSFEVLLQHELTLQQLSTMNAALLNSLLRADSHSLDRILVLLLPEQLLSLTLDRLELLLKETSNLERLIDAGFSFEDFKAADVQKFTDCLHAAFSINTILKFVTVKQLLGLDHVPPGVPIQKPRKESDSTNFYAYESGSGYNGDFFWKNKGSTFEVMHGIDAPPRRRFKLTFDCLQKEGVENEKKETNNCISMIHNWYVAHDATQANESHVTYYCPALNHVMHECCGADFSIKQWHKQDAAMLASCSRAPYYREKQFVEFLNERGCSIHELKSLPGMTVEKLSTMSDHLYDLEKLYELGLRFEEIRLVDAARLEYVLSHFHEAHYALDLVGVTELLGIGKEVPSYTPTLFSRRRPHQASNWSPYNVLNNCTIC